MMELFGENFNAQLTVWIGDQAMRTFYRCEELMLCRKPSPPRVLQPGHQLVCGADSGRISLGFKSLM